MFQSPRVRAAAGSDHDRMVLTDKTPLRIAQGGKRERGQAIVGRNHEQVGAGDFRCAAAARKPRLRPIVGTDHRRVKIGEAVDLRAAEKAHGQAPAEQPIAEHLHHRHGGERGLA